ncbi:MAG: NAD(+) diphosphatase [Gammaproteobacteria bacterium]|nr:NAD(+) diphosphatase [Gammaproteobacteria bacterium]
MTLSHRASQHLWFLVQGDHLLVLKQDHALPIDIALNDITPLFLRRFYLGESNQAQYYCAEIEENLSLPEHLIRLPLRQALSLFSEAEYAMATKAYGVINWDKNHRFCGHCGSITEQIANSFERTCQPCDLSFFPRISPSIIVLIKKGHHVLMARSPHFLPGVYGLIAGFVEPGESVEEAVHREIKEEVGLEVKNLVYMGSQPWPFPDSLMIAFIADYAAGEIEIDQHEIEEAGWYRYDQLPGRPSTAISIASKLIDDFIERCRQRP